MDLELILNIAIKDLHDLPELEHDRFPQEAQLRAALYKAYRAKGLKVFVDAKYKQASRSKCDLVVVDGVNQTWIELKVVTSRNTVGTHYPRWRTDITKLGKSPNNPNKMFILWYFWDDNQKTNARKITIDKINAFHNGPNCQSNPKDFIWNGDSCNKMALYAWKV